MTTRIYLVKSKTGEEVLIEAANQSQAIHHATKEHFICRVATTLEVAAIIGGGGKLEKAGSENEGA